VSWKTKKHAWEAYVMWKGKQYHLGLFDTIEKAAQARAEKALELQGEFARINSEYMQ
jgi:hypothetical protein